MSKKAAWVWLVALCLVGLVVLLQLRWEAQLVALASLALVAQKPLRDLRVRQHPLQFVAHGRRGNPLQRPGRNAVTQGVRRRVVEDQHVQNDVGVDDDLRRGHGRFP